MPKAEIRPHQLSLVVALPPIRPDIDSGGYVYDRTAIIRWARELELRAQDMTLEAIRLELSPAGLGLGVASRK
jgi:hypothetical protein